MLACIPIEPQGAGGCKPIVLATPRQFSSWFIRVEFKGFDFVILRWIKGEGDDRAPFRGLSVWFVNLDELPALTIRDLELPENQCLPFNVNETVGLVNGPFARQWTRLSKKDRISGAQIRELSGSAFWCGIFFPKKRKPTHKNPQDSQIWCALGFTLSAHQPIRDAMQQVGHFKRFAQTVFRCNVEFRRSQNFINLF